MSYEVDLGGVERDLAFLEKIKSLVNQGDLLTILRTRLEDWQYVAVRRTLIKLIEAQEALEEKLDQ